MNAPLLPLPGLPRTSNRLFLWRPAERMWLVKLYSGPDAWGHRACEREKLCHWRRHGLVVPADQDCEIPKLAGQPYLVLEYVAGCSLGQKLRDPQVSPREKVAALEEVYCANRRRHDLALQRRDALLVHPDLNTGNILLAHTGPCYIDHEASLGSRDLRDAVAAEIGKLTRWAAYDLGPAWLDRVVGLLAGAYSGQEALLDRVVANTQERRFQFLHRWRDSRRKARQPEEVTKYDVTDALARALHKSA